MIHNAPEMNDSKTLLSEILIIIVTNHTTVCYNSSMYSYNQES